MKPIALLLALSLVTTVAAAQEPGRAAPAPPAAPAAQPTVVVVGVVPRPLPWIRSRSGIHYRPAERRPALAPSVLRAVRRAPF
jgi:hypothetical protein